MAPRSPTEMTATEEDREMYSYGRLSFDELNEKYENRPRNINRTLPFHDLYENLFNPLMDNKNSKGRTGKVNKLSPHAMRRQVIERYISRWRSTVGYDFLPAMKLILPEKDRDRAMYGLKEKAIAKLLIKLVSIDSKSDDAMSLINWKVPGNNGKTAGDFPERCYQVLLKRPSRNKPGNMTIGEVNILLDKLALSQKDEDQLPILQQFYNQMNAEELTWLIRIILRQMKLGASEKTILELFHPEGEALFNISSSLRRVCWELWDPTNLIDKDSKHTIEIMQCFQPQLAQFQSHSFQVMIQKLGCGDGPFWIEEKLDGERMQLHMEEDDCIPGGMRFAFYSRKGKDYTYLYGEGYEDNDSALTRHIKPAFDTRVRSIILDGEMITWDPIGCKMVPFGTLKSAANSERENPFGETGNRPLFRVFDCLYMNGKVLTRYELKERRKALEGVFTNVKERIELHEYEVATSVDAIEPALRKVVEEASEGLVLKNPASMYELNSRNNNWMKVKPEYMTEFGESLDCVVIGGYYGSGRRGGDFSSFMCGLLVSKNYRDSHPGTHPEKCVSFFKVGGGFRAGDYREIKERLAGKWQVWDSKNPPDEYIFLGGDRKQLLEKPDEWIKPSDSIVVEVKAASVGPTNSFSAGVTLRFPRFKRFRFDKSWEASLSEDEFAILKEKSDQTSKEKEFSVAPKRRAAKRLKKQLTFANNGKVTAPYAGSKTNLFDGLTFFIMTDMLKPKKKTKADIKQMIKANGGATIESSTIKAKDQKAICVGEKNVSEVAGLIRKGETNIVRPAWVLDAIKQEYLIPFEPCHMYHMTEHSAPLIEENVDVYGDSYARDLSTDELTVLLDNMIYPKNSEFSAQQFLTELEERGKGDMLGGVKASMFRGCVVRFLVEESLDTRILMHKFRFAGGQIALDDDAEGITHFFVAAGVDGGKVKVLRSQLAGRLGRRLPRIVALEWLTDSWSEGTLLDEERYTNFER